MNHLKQAFCLLAVLTLTFPLTAQQAVWTHLHPEPSRIFGFVQLENENTLLASQYLDTIRLTEVDPEDGSQLSLKALTMADKMVYLEQHSNDTLLTVSENGFLWTLDRNGDTLTRIVQLFPELAASNDYFEVTRGDRIGDTLFIYAHLPGANRIWYARVVNEEGIYSSVATDSGGTRTSLWHSDDGLQVSAIRQFGFDTTLLTVNNANGEEILSISFTDNVFSVRKVLFYQPDRFFALTSSYNGSFYVSQLLDVNSSTGTYRTIPLPSPNPILGILLSNMRLIDNEILLVGSIGRGNPHVPIAYSFNIDNDEIWQFHPDLNLGFGSFTDVSASPVTPNEYLFFGDIALDDVGITGRAFVAAGELIKTSTRNVETLPLNVYPNPVADRLQITGTDETPDALTVFDQTGRKVIQAANQSDLEVSSLPTGMYFIVTTVGQKFYTAKFLKR